MSAQPVDVLAREVFEAYSHNSGNPPELHYDRAAAEQWMAQALTDAGVAELMEAAQEHAWVPCRQSRERMETALARYQGGAA